MIMRELGLGDVVGHLTEKIDLGPAAPSSRGSPDWAPFCSEPSPTSCSS